MACAFDIKAHCMGQAPKGVHHVQGLLGAGQPPILTSMPVLSLVLLLSLVLVLSLVLALSVPVLVNAPEGGWYDGFGGQHQTGNQGKPEAKPGEETSSPGKPNGKPREAVKETMEG